VQAGVDADHVHRLPAGAPGEARRHAGPRVQAQAG
jgi:hypothetical protein